MRTFLLAGIVCLLAVSSGFVINSPEDAASAATFPPRKATLSRK